jgi:hypothetical protein
MVAEECVCLESGKKSENFLMHEKIWQTLPKAALTQIGIDCGGLQFAAGMTLEDQMWRCLRQCGENVPLRIGLHPVTLAVWGGGAV